MSGLSQLGGHVSVTGERALEATRCPSSGCYASLFASQGVRTHLRMILDRVETRCNRTVDPFGLCVEVPVDNTCDRDVA
jgi:hypothetical protein